MAPWPARLTAPPPRLADFGYSNEMFEKDMVIKWQHLLACFRLLFGSLCFVDALFSNTLTDFSALVCFFIQELWRHRVENYWNLLSPKIESNTLRNVMDMKANMGSFAAALKDKDVWVMNVVPEDGPNTLKLIYDRGLIGSIHNWYANQVTGIRKAYNF